MSRTRIAASITLLAILLAVDLWLAPNLSLERSSTSFGVTAGGYKAAFDVLAGLGFAPERSYIPPGPHTDQTGAARARWFVAPDFLDPDKSNAEAEATDVLGWIRAGGIAVIFGGRDDDWQRLGVARETSAGGDDSVISGSIARRARKLPIAGLLRFKPAAKPADDHARVLLTADGAPFALELKIGSGRLVAIADSSFLRNASLGIGDASPLAVDLAIALGAPSFDEWSHGFAPPGSIVAMLLRSRAILFLFIAIFAALAWILEQHSWPRRELDQAAGQPAPSIASFIDSLGLLYSRTGDPAAALRAYRSGFIRRMRRQISPGAELREEVVLDRLARDRAMSAETRRWLIDGAAPANQAELVAAVRAIESYRRVGA
ncbi:MAG: DUF4350 domain-containing protein [Candidatus Binataceae bacterium]